MVWTGLCILPLEGWEGKPTTESAGAINQAAKTAQQVHVSQDVLPADLHLERWPH